MTKCPKCKTEFDHGICPKCGFTEGGVYVSNPKKTIADRKEAEKKLEEMRRQEEDARKQRLNQIKAREKGEKNRVKKLQEEDERKHEEYLQKKDKGVGETIKGVWEEQVEDDKERKKLEKELRKNRKKALKKLAIGTGATAAAGGAAIAASQRQQPPPPPPAYKKKSALVKYLGIVVILVAVGLVGYFHRDDLSDYGKDFLATIGGLIPNVGGNEYLDCLLHPEKWSYCWAGTPVEQEVNKYKVVKIVLEKGRPLENPTRGDEYSVQFNVKNLLEGVTIDDVVISGRLECKIEGDWGKENRDVPLNSRFDSYPLTPAGIKDVLTSDELSCELTSCQKLVVDVTYNYNNTLTTKFRFGTSEETAKMEEEEYMDHQGPISLESDFGPFDNYYYPGGAYDYSHPGGDYGGEVYGGENQLYLMLTMVNKGDGKGIITDYAVEKKSDTLDFLSYVQGCEYDGTEIELKEMDDSEMCTSTYNFNDNRIESFLSENNPYRTVEFAFDVDYEYTRSVRKSISLEEGDICVDENEDTQVNGGGDNGNSNGGGGGNYIPPSSAQIENFLGLKNSYMAGLGECMLDAYEKTGVPVELMFAIPPIEGGGWSRESSLQASPCNNLYSIKGSGCSRTTWECYEFDTGFCKPPGDSENRCEDLSLYDCTIEASFKRYKNKCDSVNDFVALISGSSTYSEAMKYTDDPKRMVKEMNEAGYATDPYWHKKVSAKIQEYWDYKNDPYMP